MRTRLQPRLDRWTKKYTPRFEALEDRTTPSVTASLSSGVLTLTGDLANDNVTVRATGTDAVQVTTFDNNNTTPVTQTFNNVTSIVANLGEGNNTLTVNPTLDTNLMLNVTTGGGNDFLNIGLNGNVLT